MSTHNSSKLFAIGVALLINIVIFGGAAFIFDGRAHHTVEGKSVALSDSQAVHVV